MSWDRAAGLLLVLGALVVLGRHYYQRTQQQPAPRDVWGEHDAGWRLFPAPEFAEASDWAAWEAEVRS